MKPHLAKNIGVEGRENAHALLYTRSSVYSSILRISIKCINVKKKTTCCSLLLHSLYICTSPRQQIRVVHCLPLGPSVRNRPVSAPAAASQLCSRAIDLPGPRRHAGSAAPFTCLGPDRSIIANQAELKRSFCEGG